MSLVNAFAMAHICRLSLLSLADLESKHMVQLPDDIYCHILHHVRARSDITQCRLVSKRWEEIAARQVLRTCDVVLKEAGDVTAFRRFLCEYEPGAPPGQEQEQVEQEQGPASENARAGLVLSATWAARRGLPRRFYFLTGHITLAVGCVSGSGSGGDSESGAAARAALEEVFGYATRLTSLAVEDVDATLCAVPRLVRLWSALPCLRRFAVGYTPAPAAGSSAPTETPSGRRKDSDTDRDGKEMEMEMEKERAWCDRSWESDRILRCNAAGDRGTTRFRLCAVRDLYLRFGSRRNIPLGLWVDVCPDMRRLHVVTDERAALMTVLRVRPF